MYNKVQWLQGTHEVWGRPSGVQGQGSALPTTNAMSSFKLSNFKTNRNSHRNQPLNERCAREWGRREFRGIRGFPAGMGLNVAGIPRGWIWQLRDSRGDGFFFGGDPAGMVDKFGCE